MRHRSAAQASAFCRAFPGLQPQVGRVAAGKASTACSPSSAPGSKAWKRPGLTPTSEAHQPLQPFAESPRSWRSATRPPAARPAAGLRAGPLEAQRPGRREARSAWRLSWPENPRKRGLRTGQAPQGATCHFPAWVTGRAVQPKSSATLGSEQQLGVHDPLGIEGLADGSAGRRLPGRVSSAARLGGFIEPSAVLWRKWSRPAARDDVARCASPPDARGVGRIVAAVGAKHVIVDVAVADVAEG